MKNTVRVELLCHVAVGLQKTLEDFRADQPNMSREDFENFADDVVNDLSSVVSQYLVKASHAAQRGDVFQQAVYDFKVQYVVTVMNNLSDVWVSKWPECNACSYQVSPFDLDDSLPCPRCRD